MTHKVCFRSGIKFVVVSETAVCRVKAAYQEVAIAIVLKWRVQFYSHPSRACGRECALEHFVFCTDRHHVGITVKLILVCMLQIDLHTTHGECRRAGIVEGDGGDSTIHPYPRSLS